MKTNTLLKVITQVLLFSLLLGFISSIVTITTDYSLFHAKNECHDTRSDCWRSNQSN